LAIVKKLVEEHMGFIEAENAKKHGAVIKIFMPKNEEMREKMISSYKHKKENGAYSL
jgi:signal transduction histidine kinase